MPYRTPEAGNVEATLKLGYALGRIAHRLFQGQDAPGVLIEADLGYRLSSMWSVGFQVSGTETPVTKTGADRYAPRGSSAEAHPIGSTRLYDVCAECPSTPGGLIFAASIRTAIIGPRIEFSPRALAGSYLGLAAGVGSVALEETDLANAIGVRCGYRYQFASSAAAGMGLGLTGIFAESTRAWVPYAAAELRLF